MLYRFYVASSDAAYCGSHVSRTVAFLFAEHAFKKTLTPVTVYDLEARVRAPYCWLFDASNPTGILLRLRQHGDKLCWENAHKF